MTRRGLSWMALACVVGISLVLAARPTGGRDLSPAARAERIATQLRCPVCQGLSVADSPSPTARAIADDIGRRVKAGESDDEIRQAYVDRYGEWVLLRPRGSGLSSIVWAAPVAAVAAAGGALAVSLARRRGTRGRPAVVSDADRALVEQER